MWVNLLVIFLTIILGVPFILKERIVYHADNHGGLVPEVISNRKTYIFLISILLIFQSGSRNVAVGSDTYQYFRIFEEVKTMSWSEIFQSLKAYYQLGIGKDPGYLVVQKIFLLFSQDYQVYLFFIAIVFFSALGSFIYKNTTKTADAIFAFVLYSTLFYSMFSITGIRQTIATAMALFGYELIKKRKLIPFLILIFLASTIHKSVLIFVLLYFIRSKRVVKYLLFSFIVFLPILFLFSKEVSLFIGSLEESYSIYEHNEKLKPYNFVILNFIIFFLGVLTYKDALRYSYNNSIFWYAALFFTAFFTTQVFQVHGFMRIIYYFSIFYLLLIPFMFQILSRKIQIENRHLIFFGISLLIILYINSSYNHEYKFFWETMRLGDNYR